MKFFKTAKWRGFSRSNEKIQGISDSSRFHDFYGKIYHFKFNFAKLHFSSLFSSNWSAF
jgi:hypothetical protein